jgi:hypothetical protein
VEVTGKMDVVEARHNLAKYGRNEPTGESASLPGFDEMIKIALHGFEDEVKFLGGGKKKEIVQGDDVGMKRNSSQRL